MRVPDDAIVGELWAYQGKELGWKSQKMFEIDLTVCKPYRYHFSIMRVNHVVRIILKLMLIILTPRSRWQSLWAICWPFECTNSWSHGLTLWKLIKSEEDVAVPDRIQILCRFNFIELFWEKELFKCYHVVRQQLFVNYCNPL